nr:reverse transcriptase domain-containing protein [Tanacetum cinerariifolium]
MNTASTSGSGPLPSNTIANPKGELKAITIRSGLVLDGPSIPMPHPFINPKENKRVEETLTDPELAEYTIKGNDDLPFDIESNLREIEYLINHNPTKEMDSIFEDSVDECNLADPINDLVDTIPDMQNSKNLGQLGLRHCRRYQVDAIRSSSKLARDQTSNPTSSANPTPKGRIRRSSKQKVENSHFEENLTPVDTMTDNRTMAEMLRAPTEGCAEAIVVPPITFKDVPNSVIKLILFPFSLAGAARRWLEKKPPRSITTWDDLVSKFINEFFPPSRTTNLRNEISNFQQKFDESFLEAWERYKDLLHACPNHGFTKLHQLDTFYNALNPADQDSLNAAAGGNLLEKSPQDALTIIENKSKVHNSRSKPIPSPVNACNNHSSSELAKLTHAVNQQTSDVTTVMTAILKQFQSNPPPAQVKAVQEICVTCGGSGTLPGNTIANPKGELKAITTRSRLVTEGPTVPNPPKPVNPEEDECVEETYKDPDHAEYNIK